MTAPYPIDYALDRVREAVDFADIEGDFTPLRKWINELEYSLQPNELGTQMIISGGEVLELSSGNTSDYPA